jgi:hypothetical protein
MDYGPRYRRMAELAATEGLMSMTRRAILRCQFSSGPRTKKARPMLPRVGRGPEAPSTLDRRIV